MKIKIKPKIFFSWIPNVDYENAVPGTCIMYPDQEIHLLLCHSSSIKRLYLRCDLKKIIVL